MKIGIFVHSKTGNTYSVAQKLKDKLLSLRHFVAVEKIIAEDDDQPDASKIVLKSAPGTQGYDVLILGAPVRAFSLSPVMRSYLTGIESLEGVRVFCFVTQQLPYPWLGGNRSIRQMRELLSAKGALILGSGMINWSGKKREDQIDSLVQSAAGAI